MTSLGIENIAQYEHALLEYGIAKLSAIPGLTLVGTAANKTSVLSFVLAGHENEAVGRYLSQVGIAVRSGHHCAQPILRRLGYESTVRPSLAFFITRRRKSIFSPNRLPDLPRGNDAVNRVRPHENRKAKSLLESRLF